jgi:hypothetical protein
MNENNPIQTDASAAALLRKRYTGRDVWQAGPGVRLVIGDASAKFSNYRDADDLQRRNGKGALPFTTTPPVP